MATVNFMKIDSFSVENTNIMFDELCKKVCNTTPLEAKRVILEMDEKDEYLNRYKASLNDLARLISFYDISIELKATYLTGEKDTSIDESKKKILEAPDNRSEEVQLMEKQSKEITSPEFKEISGTNAKVDIVPPPPLQAIDPNQIPKFP